MYRSPAVFTLLYSALPGNLKPRFLLQHLQSDRTSLGMTGCPGISLSLQSKARTPLPLILTHCSPQKPFLICGCFASQKPHTDDPYNYSHWTTTPKQLQSYWKKICLKEVGFLVCIFRFNVNTKPKHQVLLIKQKGREVYKFINKSWKLLSLQDTESLEKFMCIHGWITQRI